MAAEILSFPDAAGVARAAANRWLGELAQKPPGTVHTVAMSGGRIAKDFFQEVTRQVKERFLSVADVHFFWSDERCVPPTDPESNFAAARDLLLEPLKVPADQIHRLRGEVDEAVALREAVESITQVCPRNPKGQPVLDVIFLGMGEDGHVASLFPGEPAEVTTDPTVFRTVTAVKPPPRRITMGYPAIAAAKEVWVLATGKGKEQALRESLSPQGKTPLARVLRSRSQTRIFTDVAP